MEALPNLFQRNAVRQVYILWREGNPDIVFSEGFPNSAIELAGDGRGLYWIVYPNRQFEINTGIAEAG